MVEKEKSTPISAEEFNALPNNEKRILIAKDVILQVESQRIKLVGGAFIKSKKLETFLNKQHDSVQLQTVLPDFVCTVCAKGALFLSDITTRNNYMVCNLSIDNRDIEYKLDYFDNIQLDLIEMAFETKVFSHTNRKLYEFTNNRSNSFKASTDEGKAAIAFGRTIMGDKRKRLIAIMQNIIDNDGTFIPPAIPLKK